MKTLQLEPDQLNVDSFPIENLIEDINGAATLPTCLPATCPECPRTRNPLCY